MSAATNLAGRLLSVMRPDDVISVVFKRIEPSPGEPLTSALYIVSYEELARELGGSVPPPQPPPIPAQQVRVNTPQLNVRAGPGTTFAIVRKVRSGDVLTVEETRGDWIRIGAAEWVSAAYVARV